MDLSGLSTEFSVRKLCESDLDRIYDLCKENEDFYRFDPPFVTRESILSDMRLLPPGKELADKFYIGFFKDNDLAAVMDFVLDYPVRGVIYIGLFITKKSLQRQGMGTRIISGCASCFKKHAYKKIRLAVACGNTPGETFWHKNSFIKTGEEAERKSSVYFLMEREL